MRRTNDEDIRIEDCRRASGKKEYVRPELVKKERLLGVTGSTPPPAT